MAQSVADIITSSLNDRMTSIESENKMLHEQVTQLTARVNELELHNQTTTRNLDTAEQYSRRACLRISGMSETAEESTDQIVLNIARACHVLLSEIDRFHRVYTRRPPAASNTKTRPADIIVKFVSYRSRAAFFKGKTELKSNPTYKGVSINDDLTRPRAELLRNARSLVRNNKLNSAWSYDGRIYVRCTNGSRRLITTQDDLNNP